MTNRYEFKTSWECPRCHRINSPWNPACFCVPNQENIQEYMHKNPMDISPLI